MEKGFQRNNFREACIGSSREFFPFLGPWSPRAGSGLTGKIHPEKRDQTGIALFRVAQEMQEKLSSVANLGCSEGIDKKQNLDKAFSALGTLSGSRFCRYNRKFRIPPRLHTTPLACPFVWHFDKLLPHSFDALKRRMGFTSGNGR